MPENISVAIVLMPRMVPVLHWEPGLGNREKLPGPKASSTQSIFIMWFTFQ